MATQTLRDLRQAYDRCPQDHRTETTCGDCGAVTHPHGRRWFHMFSPARPFMGIATHKGEIHISDSEDLEHLRHDAANPLPATTRVLTVPTDGSDEELSKLIEPYMKQGYWVCWCCR